MSGEKATTTHPAILVVVVSSHTDQRAKQKDTMGRLKVLQLLEGFMRWVTEDSEPCEQSRTAVHTHHEHHLTLALSLVALSSLEAVYREKFGRVEDYVYVAMVFAWLSRHVMLRWICTNDRSTTRKPTPFGVLVHWISSSVVAGQYFDRTDSVPLSDEGTLQSAVFGMPSLAYTVHYFRTAFVHPLLRMKDSLYRFWLYLSGRRRATVAPRDLTFEDRSTTRNDRDGLDPTDDVTTTLGNHKLKQLWTNYVPTPRFAVPFMVVLILAVQFIRIFQHDRTSQYHVLTAHLTDKHHRDHKGAAFPLGRYHPYIPVTLSNIVVFAMFSGTVVCFVLYGRITMPFPDLVAGGNVLEDVRNEARGGANNNNNSNTIGVSPFVGCVRFLWALLWKDRTNSFWTTCHSHHVQFCVVVLLYVSFSLSLGHCDENVSMCV